jgi:ribosomal protein S18 acetylase RimI-like enzyme
VAISVRPATVDDYAAVGDICVDAYRDDGQLDGPGSGYEQSLRDVVTRAADAEVMVAVDSATGDLVGSVTFAMPDSSYAELSRDGEAEFRMLAVSPKAQGRGVGKALVHACVERAKALNLSALVICFRDSNDRALRMYQGLGFQRVPDLDWSPMPDVHLLGLRLDLSRAPV